MHPNNRIFNKSSPVHNDRILFRKAFFLKLEPRGFLYKHILENTMKEQFCHITRQDNPTMKSIDRNIISYQELNWSRIYVKKAYSQLYKNHFCSKK